MNIIIMFEFLLFFYSFIAAIVTMILIVIDVFNSNDLNWGLVAAFIFFILVMLSLMRDPYQKKVPEQIKEDWKYKDYQAVSDHLDNNSSIVNYSKEDKERLVKLLFLGWFIVDDSNSDELILNRKSTNKDETIIFQQTNKKSL